MPDKIARMKLQPGNVNEATRQFQLNGCLTLEQSFDPDLVLALQDDFLENYASRERAEVEKTCLKVGTERFMFTVELKGSYLDPGIYASPGVMPVVKALLGDDCIIQSFGVVCAYPGAGLQHIHRDHPPLFKEAGGLNAFFPPFALHVVVPLVDLDERTGTTALWEGSHRIKSTREETRWSKEEMEKLEGAVLPMPRVGDCYLMDYRLRHTGTANTSDRPRPILYMVYSRRWFLDRRNFEIQSPLRITPENFESLPDQYKPLFEIARPPRF
jgi:ectoine hydroxylase-related dioxygenase (phytanoyl-CoA dioxygenase family)